MYIVILYVYEAKKIHRCPHTLVDFCLNRRQRQNKVNNELKRKNGISM